MKGLLLKDWYVIRRECCSLLILDALFLLLRLFSGENLFFAFYLCATSGLLAFTLIAYDERVKWDVYAGALPYTRAQLVSCKYLVCLIQSGVTLLLVALVSLVPMLRLGTFTWEGYTSLLFILLTISLVAPAILFMLVFKLGSQKGRIFYYLTLGVICAAYGPLGMSGRTPQASSPLLTAVIAAGSIVLYAVSWLVSIRFYEQREF